MNSIQEIIAKLEEINEDNQYIDLHDSFDIELSESFVIETGVVGFTTDGIILEADQTTLELLNVHDIIVESKAIDEKMILGMSSDASSAGSKVQGESYDLDEAEYQGRKVQLGKPMAGDVKKSKVYVRGPKGNVVKVNFGDKNMRIKKSNPKRRKSFRARHNCANPGPRWKARYWSCRMWWDMRYIIYKIVNQVNGRYYIGRHATKNINDSYMGSGKAILNAIKKYGIESFTKEILAEASSREELWELEKQIVNDQIVNDPLSYNMAYGGKSYLDGLKKILLNISFTLALLPHIQLNCRLTNIIENLN